MAHISSRARALLTSSVATAVFFAAGMAGTASAQEVLVAQSATGSISGIVTADADGNYRTDATVSIPALNITGATDSNGRYTLNNVPAGTHEVVFSYFGAQTKKETVTVVANQMVTANAELQSVEQRGGETVVVTALRPIAESIAAALQVQRNSESLVSVVSADSVGRFPDQNIAYAVGRLPGVSVERDQGQARYINLRGSPINWVTVGFDGLNIVSPEGRATRFDNIPSAIASQIIVTKAITANMPGDTVAGNVNIKTRSAFDYPGLKVSASGGIGITDLGGGEEYDTTLVVSNRFLNDQFGILVQASKYKRRMATDNFETDPYVGAGGNVAITPTAPVCPGAGTTLRPRDCRPGYEDRRWAREFENKLYRLTRENQSFSGRIDYRPNNDNKLFFSSIYTEYRDIELRSNWIFRMDNGAVPTPLTACPAITAPQTNSGFADICVNQPNKGTVFGTQITSNFNSLDSKEWISTNTLGGEHKVYSWDLSWRLNYTKTEDGFDAPGLSNFASPATITDRPTVDYDFTDNDENFVRLYRTVVTGTGATAVRSKGARVFSIEEFPQVLTGAGIQTREGVDTTEAWTGKVDATRDLQFFNNPLTVRLGAMYTDRSKTTLNRTFAANAAQIAAAGRPPVTFNTIFKEQTYIGKLDLGYTFRYHSKSALDNLAADLKNAGIATLVDNSAGFFDVSEKITAAYAMGTLEQSWGNVVFGVRAERTENTGTAFATVAGVQRLVTVSKEDTLLFPSAHINWNITDDLKARVGITTGASRPDFDQLAPNFSVNDTLQTISGGNPEAGPEKSTGIDAYLEWYLQPQGFFSAGVYYKDIKDVLFTQADLFGLSTLNTPGVDRSGYTFTTLRNGGNGYLKGFEIAYQQSAETLVDAWKWPAWLGGFGIQGTAVFNSSEVEVPSIRGANGVVVPARKVRLPGTSKETYNASLYYEKYGLSVRLSYQYRTDWGQSIGSYQVLNGKVVPETNGDVFWDNDVEVDLAVRYSVNKNVEYFFNASNLTDSSARRFAGTYQFPIERETFGRRYMMGLKLNF